MNTKLTDSQRADIRAAAAALLALADATDADTDASGLYASVCEYGEVSVSVSVDAVTVYFGV